MMTRRDPWVNMLRTTIACFAAAVGGADAITVAAVRRGDRPAGRLRAAHRPQHPRRAARRVEPGPGDRRGRRVVVRRVAHRRSWPRRRGTCSPRIERAGGALAALDDGAIGELLAETHDRARRGHRPPPGADHRRQRVRLRRRAAGRARRRCRPNPAGLLPRVRYARSSRRCAIAPTRRRERPRVFLAALGPAAAHSARRRLRRQPVRGRRHRVPCTGPVDGRSPPPARRWPACARRTRSTPTRPNPPRPGAARRPGAAQVWLAGKADVDGVDGYLFAGCDALAVLRSHARRAGGGRAVASPTSRRDARLRARAPPARRSRPGRRARGRRPRASPSRRSTPPPISADVDFLRHLSPASRRSCAARTRRCTSTSRGRSGSTPASPPRPSRTRSTGATSPWGRRGCRSRSTCPPTAATTATTRGSSAMSAWPASRSTRSTTCGSCSTASRSTR